MSGQIDAALKDRWDAQNLDAAVPGGLHFGELPRADASGERIAPPYAVLSHVAKRPVVWTTAGQIHDHLLQFSVWDATKAAVEAHLAALKAAFDFAPLTLTGGSLLELRPANDDGLIAKEDESVWQGVLTYRLRYEKPVAYS